MGCLQQYQVEKMVEATWTSSNNIKSWYSSKEGFVIILVGLQRNCLFWTLTTQPNDQFYIEQLTKLNNAVEEKRPELTNRKMLYSIVTMQGHIFGHSAKNYWSLRLLSDYFLFRSLQNSLNKKLVKISIMMMISNRTWFSFLLIKTRSFMNVGLWWCLKDGKRSLIKMGNTLRNKVI